MKRLVFPLALVTLTALAALAHRATSGGAAATPVARAQNDGPAPAAGPAERAVSAVKVDMPPREADELMMARRAAALGGALVEKAAGRGARRQLTLAAMHFRAALAYEAAASGDPVFASARHDLAHAEAKLAELNAPGLLGAPREIPAPPQVKPVGPRPAPLGVGPDGVPFERVGG